MQKGDWFIYIKFREKTGKSSQLVTEGVGGGKDEKAMRGAFEKLKEKDQEENLGIEYMDLCCCGEGKA